MRKGAQLLKIEILILTLVALLILPPTLPALAQGLTSGYYEESAPWIDYIGSWSNGTWNASIASGGSYKYTTDTASYVSLTFTGSTITIYRILWNARGDARICIDDECHIYNSYSETLVMQSPVSFTVEYGTHSVTINLVSGNALDIDAIAISGAASSTPIPVGESLFITPTPWGRPTPTMWAYEDGVDHAGEIAFNADESAAFADTIINSYNFLDQGGAISTVIFFLMSFAILGLLFRVVRRLRKG